MLILDSFQLRILIFEEGDLLLVLYFISIVILQFMDLLPTRLEIHLQLLVLLGQPFITALQLLDLLITPIMALLNRHNLLNNLLPDLRLPVPHQRLLVPRIQPFIIPLSG